MVEMAEEKMAKSVRNIRLLHGAIEQFGPETFLMWLVGAHYRKPVAYTEEALEDAARAVDRLRELIRRLEPDGAEPPELDAIVERFFDQLADDFNTPAARAELFAWATEANRRVDAGERIAPGRLREMLEAFGLERLLDAAAEHAPEEVERLAAEREEARAVRDFERADRLRDELAARGWIIRDTPQGPRLVRT
jgi:cysteinyl-tRNA synthetase